MYLVSNYATTTKNSLHIIKVYLNFKPIFEHEYSQIIREGFFWNNGLSKTGSKEHSHLQELYVVLFSRLYHLVRLKTLGAYQISEITDFANYIELSSNFLK